MARLFRPVETLGIIWGAKVRPWHTYSSWDMFGVRDGGLFSGPETKQVALSGDIKHNTDPTPRSSRYVFNILAQPESGRSLLVAILDTRVYRRGHYQPMYFGADLERRTANEPRAVLDMLCAAVRRNQPQHPIDVFMLVPERPDFIHDYADQLPVGSVLVALKTPAKANKRWFAHTHEQMNKNGWPYAPGAKELLIDYLASDTPLAKTLPEIAVSGYKSQNLRKIHQTMIDRGGIDWTAPPPVPGVANPQTYDHIEEYLRQTEPATVARIRWLQERRRYSEVDVENTFEVRVEGLNAAAPSDYFYTVMEMAPEIFGPTHSWQQLDEARLGVRADDEVFAPPVPAGYTVAGNQSEDEPAGVNTGALEPVRQRQADHLSNAEIARLPERLRKFAPALPASLRRALRAR